MKRKTLILLTAITLSAAIILAGSYAWFWDTDEAPNQFVLANLGARITEVYEPRTVIPGLEIDKNVTISNDKSNIPILVRVSFQEVLENLLAPGENGAPLITWKPFGTAAGDLEIPLMASEAFIDTVRETGSGWESVTYGTGLSIYRKVAQNANQDTFYTYFAYVTETGQLAQLINVTHAVDGKTIVSADVELAYNTKIDVVQTADIVFKYGSASTWIWDLPAAHQTDISPYMEFIFGPDVVSGAAADQKWFYDDGYFYYRALLEAGQETPQLLAQVKFLETIPNAFQGATYTLIPRMEALQPTAGAMIGQWGLSETSSAYIALYPYCEAYMNGTWVPGWAPAP